MPPLFLIVCSKMFDGSYYAFVLNASDVSACNLRSKEWIFSIVLEISSAMGGTIDVYTRSKQNSDSSCLTRTSARDFALEANIGELFVITASGVFSITSTDSAGCARSPMEIRIKILVMNIFICASYLRVIHSHVETLSESSP